MTDAASRLSLPMKAALRMRASGMPPSHIARALGLTVEETKMLIAAGARKLGLDSSPNAR